MSYYIWDVEHDEKEIYFTETNHKMFGEQGISLELYDEIINQYPDYQLIEYAAGFLYYLRYLHITGHTIEINNKN